MAENQNSVPPGTDAPPCGSRDVASVEETASLTPPMDGTPFYALVRVPMRWKAYKPGTAQLRQGIKGRWQRMSEWGGWENCAEPNLSAWEHHPDYAKALGGDQ